MTEKLNTVQNGKGDRERIGDRKRFGDNYDLINWKKKELYNDTEKQIHKDRQGN